MRLPLKYQVALAPALIIVLLVALIVYLQYELNAIRAENEAVREWTRVVETAGAAVGGAVNLDQVAGYIDWTRRTDAGNVAALEDFHFRYLDQYRDLRQTLAYPGYWDRLSDESRRFIEAIDQDIRYAEPLDTDRARIALAELIPRLEEVQSSFLAKRRYAFTEYYRNVNRLTSSLGVVATITLVAGVLIAVIASLWTMRTTRRRLQRLAQEAGAVCELREPGSTSLVFGRDELEDLAACMQNMTRRLVDVVGSEKLLEGAEEERRRIAMDIHDQTLADITSLMREARALSEVKGLDETSRRRLAGLAQGLEELTGDMRRVIDDLHPQTLEILGLGAALRSHLEKRLGGEGQPAFYLNIDREGERRLTPFARLGLYRILVEAAHNVVRHAAATRYEIDGRLQDDTLVLTLEDNGRGMRVEEVRGQGRGILNIERRARAIGAEVSWGRSRFSQGTRLEVRVPLTATTPADHPRQAHG
ncbi:MAG TPA: DUF1049 domain-containing protein [Thioalkalivibrio sp.]|nr:DUF1049 domain-containing protein [Thioalkalivibrio sp.]